MGCERREGKRRLHRMSRFAIGLGLVLFLATGGLAAPEKIVVADDKEYPPFVFLDAARAPKGILVDIWNLWSSKTGIPVEFQLMEWDAAVSAVKDGRADALGGVFHTPERDEFFELTTQVTEISTAIFFHHQIGGIKNLDDLEGFKVGVVKGDSAHELILSRHPGLIVATYPGARDMISAAMSGEIKVFISDTPVALYYLAQHPQGGEFRQATEIVAVNSLHSALRKNNTELLTVVQDGFDQISAEEIRDILEDWSGKPVVSPTPWRGLAAGFAGLSGILVVVFAWNVSLRRRVGARTKELAASLRELSDREERYRLLVEHQTDLVVKVDTNGRFLYVNPAYCRTFGQAEEDLMGNTFMPLVHEDDRLSTEEAMKALHVPPYRAYMEQRAMTVSGWRWFAWNDSAVLGPTGMITEIIGIGRDITDRKQSEELLRQSEERFAKAFHSSPAPLVISDIASGRFIDVNDRWVEMLGHSKEEQIGRTSKEVGIWSDPETRDRAIAILHENGSFKDYPIEFLTKTGQIRSALWSAEIVSLQGREVMLSLLIDSTERKNAEDSLRKSEALYRSVVDNIQDVFYRTDAAGLLTMVSPSGVRLLGYDSADEMLGRPNEDFWLEPAARMDFLERIKSQGKVTDFEVVLKRKDGMPVLVATSSSLYFDDGGVVLGVEGIFRDITERKRAEELLRQSEEKFSRLFMMSPDAISLSEPDSGLLVDVNDAYAQLTKYSRAELIGKVSLELRLFTSIDSPRRVVERLKSTGHASNIEVEIRRKDGSLVPCSVSCQFVTIGEETFLLAVMRDLTEFKRMQELMIQSEKMISVGGIAAGIAHEINNPLGIIVQTAQNLVLRTRPDFRKNIEVAESLGLDMALLEKYMQARKILSFVQDIQVAAARASDIIRHMLDFSRRNESRRTRCAISEIVERAVELAKNDYDLKKNYDFKRIAIIKDYAQDLKDIECTETELEQVFLNLLRNAAQAIGMSDPPTPAPRIVIRLANVDQGVRIEVADNGPGMPPEMKRRVFEPFFTTKPPGIGTGLGLSVSYFIVTRGHAGKMWVESSPGGGAKFVIELPLALAANEETATIHSS